MSEKHSTYTTKAIETRYNGYLFRSRLEARWAVYLDAIGLEWEYEREGFDLGDVCYLPDFWLPQVRMWAEVKPEAFDKEELRKAALLAWKNGHPVILLEGMPDMRAYDFLFFSDCNTWGEIGLEIGVDVGEDEGMIHRTGCVISMFCNYPIDENRFFTSTGRDAAEPYPEWCQPGEMYEDIGRAVRAARSARFEYGRSGAC